ncbi:MAG: T9SS type A sorting domain-containing protein, partial [Candidatus Latescibacterota bacterium]
PGDVTTTDGDWECSITPGYGDYAGLFHGTSTVQEGECAKNLTYLWGFFKGSAETYACGGYPGQQAVPKGNDRGQYLMNEVWSPLIDWTHDMYGAPVPATAITASLVYDTYREGTRIGGSLVYDVWRVRSYVDGCPTEWRQWGIIYPEYHWDWITLLQILENYVEPGASHIQVALGAWDMCKQWCSVYGTDDCHSHGPLYDNVKVYRVDYKGPLWSVRDQDLFQDNFAGDGTVTGTVRADMASDKAPSYSPNIIPGDSVALLVSEPEIGLDYHISGVPSSGSAVYCHVQDSSPAKSGGAISGASARWPVVSATGGWTVLRMDTCFTEPGGPRTGPVPDKFCIDLNDNLYAPGDTVYFYFSARDTDNNTTYWSQPLGVSEFESEARAGGMEMTCLPANGLNGATDILYVDDFNERGAEPYFNSAFDMLSVTPDRFDVRGPSSAVGNGLGGRVQNIMEQLLPYYRKIIWNSGSLGYGTIGDGSYDKSDDFSALYTFIDQHGETAGIYISGDDIASEWQALAGANAVALRNDYMNFSLLDDDHVDQGEPVSPLVIGQPGSCFEHSGIADTLVALGGCPLINDFDALAAAGSSTVEMTYSNNPAMGAVVAQSTINAVGSQVGVVLSGFSYHTIRDDKAVGILDRAEHLRDILVWLGNTVDDPTATGGGSTVFKNSLSQNHPNPFNPTTTIRYSIEQKGHVSLKIYNVAGQLVRTLVNETENPRPEGFAATWDGRGNSGQYVSSGVYFYKLVAKDFTKTRKMVMIH